MASFSKRSRKTAPSDAADAGGNSATSQVPRFSDFGSSALVARVIEHVDRMISSGVLVPGQRLIEADLTSDLDVGRMPVREALRILAGDGVIELTPNRSARVKDFSPRLLLEMLETSTGILYISMAAFARRGRSQTAFAALNEATEGVVRAGEEGSPTLMMQSLLDYNRALAFHTGNTHLLETF